ncbi:hypothetical protein [Mycobacterium sp. OTB74]|jgi:hypothetical protein|uniref:hypothetical protein n=1 Tax=Mycobacterium sp. OTB74 TaxID=1853452 RepID=UPI0024765DA3|nr:hypothetical protein [Mycobacterium sp. OTB74]MDH6245031.1 hypothetical protein [Mycobacterium sp. OTB74]
MTDNDELFPVDDQADSELQRKLTEESELLMEKVRAAHTALREYDREWEHARQPLADTLTAACDAVDECVGRLHEVEDRRGVRGVPLTPEQLVAFAEKMAR